MTELLIRYKDAEGIVSERRISRIEPHEPGYIVAFCHERQEDRTFKISRIATAVDAETGEIIEDLHAFLGLEPPSKPPPPKAEPIPVGTEAIKLQRNKEKRVLFKPCVYPVIEEHAKRRFFAFFGDTCFKCVSPDPLVMDHHVPVILGGHLVPGNLVALCERGTNKKSDTPPESFYTPGELEHLKGFLDNQHCIFNFTFDRKAWEENCEGYLLSLGIAPDLVHEVLENPDHRFHIPPRDDPKPVGVTITIDNESIQRAIREVLARKATK